MFFEFIHQVNLEIKSLKQGDIKNILAYVERINGVLGVVAPKESGDLDREIEDLIDQREEARKKKDYALADAIRDKLKERGVILIDTPDGVRWKMEK